VEEKELGEGGVKGEIGRVRRGGGGKRLEGQRSRMYAILEICIEVNTLPTTCFFYLCELKHSKLID
jgi:hypothetical protein